MMMEWNGLMEAVVDYVGSTYPIGWHFGDYYQVYWLMLANPKICLAMVNLAINQATKTIPQRSKRLGVLW